MSMLTPHHTRVLDAAEELFFRFGYTRVTTEEIARHVGMSKKTLYSLFPSKKSIVIAALMRAARYVVDVRYLLNFDDPTTYRANLITFLRALAEANARFSAPLYEDLRHVEPLLYARSHGWRLRYVQDTLVAILKQGQAIGMVRPELATNLGAVVLSRVMQHFVHPDLRSKDGYIPTIDTVICVLLHGVEKPVSVPSA